MVSWLPHVVVPGLFALAFMRRLPRKWVIALAPLAWVPDLDYFSPGAHRVYSHNVWIPVALLGLAYWCWKRQRAPAPGDRFLDALTRPGWPLGLSLASFYWASHILLDVFAGGVLLFWPVMDTNFYLLYEIRVNLQTGEAIQTPEAGTSEGAPTLSEDYAWMTYEHTAVLAFLWLASLVALYVHLRRRNHARPPPPPTPPSP